MVGLVGRWRYESGGICSTRHRTHTQLLASSNAGDWKAAPLADEDVAGQPRTPAAICLS